MAKSLKILLASPEAAPFIKTGGLADVAGILPVELKSLGCDVGVFLPYYRYTKKHEFGIKLLKKDLSLKLGGSAVTFALYQCGRGGVNFYFIEKDEYYDRDNLYGTPSGDYPDNALRYGFFSAAILKSADILGFDPDIIHCNDWQTALVPFYLKHNPDYTNLFKNTRLLYTIHNLAYQGLFQKKAMSQIGIEERFFTPDALEFYGKVSFMKSGILYADAVSTVSKGYAGEILTKEYGCGLEGLLRLRKRNLYGILNGADYSDWNPETDKFIKVRYNKNSLGNKAACKQALLSEMGLSTSVKAPLLGIISRLAEQKGIDVIAAAAEEIIKLGCNLVILGAGEERYHKLLTELSKKHPENIAVKIAFDNPLAHKIEAGCDMFLMPSRYEPCGLNQMYSLKYGTIPVVRATGGLEDTIIDYAGNKENGNGFKFNNAEAQDLLIALKKAVSVYKNKEEWKKLIVKVMDLDFSWKRSAKEYLRLYNTISQK